jgi:hypothetical protein
VQAAGRAATASRAAGAASAAAAAASPHGQLKQQLSEKARHPSAIPGSFFERETKFRQSRPAKAVPERCEGPVR